MPYIYVNTEDEDGEGRTMQRGGGARASLVRTKRAIHWNIYIYIYEGYVG